MIYVRIAQKAPKFGPSNLPIMAEENKKVKKRRKRKIIVAVVLLLVIVRLLLPWGITKYVNKTLSQLDGMTGKIDDVDLSLYRGAYQIHGLDIKTISEEDVKTPFVSINIIDLSVEWRALFDGAVRGEVTLIQPELNFIATPAAGEVVSGEEEDWTKILTDLMPLEINRFEIQNGKISYIDNFVQPNVDIYFNDFNAVALNLSNSKDIEEALPSVITVESKTIGEGTFKADMKINILKQVPDFDLNAELLNVKIPALNDFFKAYANVDVETGLVSAYTEIALVDNELTGYFKPLTKDLKILSWTNENRGLLGKIYEALVGLGGNLVENQLKDQVGTKIPISGKIDNVQVGVWPTIWGLLKNAYLNPLKKHYDKSVEVDADGNVIEKEEEKEDKKFLGLF